MARIPDDEVARVKREVSIVRLVEASGVVLKRHGTSELIGLCPFHEDHSPSLLVNPTKNIYHCMGACQAGGTVLDWVMKREKVSFPRAVELLRKELPDAAAVPAKPQRTQRPSLPPLAMARDGTDQELLREVVKYYNQALERSPHGLAYLELRGIRSAEAIARFQLGFGDQTLPYRLPVTKRRDGAEVRARLKRLGVLRESGHEHLAGCITIPILDERGAVRGLYGRRIQRPLPKDTPRHLYLPGPHEGVFNVEALREGKEIILCEALIDALTFWVAGYKNVTASYGVEGFTKDHLAAFARYGTERVLLAYDRDEAGDKAAERLAGRLVKEGLDCYRVLFPSGMDANEFALKVKPAAKSLGLVLQTARWMGKGEPRTRRASDPPPADSPAPEPEPAAPSVPTPAAATETSPPPTPAAAPEVPPLSTPPPATTEAPPTTPSPTPTPTPVGPLPSSTSTAMPSALTVDVPVEQRPQELFIRLGDRQYRIRGLAKNLSYDQMKVNVLVALGDHYHVDTLELYSARQRAVFVNQAAEELALEPEVMKKDLGKVLLALEKLQDEQIRAAQEPKEQQKVLTDEEREAALALLRAPQLLERVARDFEAVGLVGEETNKLVGYLATVSRKLDQPLAVIIQSSSAAGKTFLMDSLLSFMPEEDRVKYSAMTGQSLFYMDGQDLRHKILAIVEEEGAERASYALKLLQSEGELTIASTGKDPTTGRLRTQQYKVEGPVMILLTTTAVEIDDELQNRCLILTVNEDREQTRAIHRQQRDRQTLEGLLARRDRGHVLEVHRNAQRLLKPLLVTNPWAHELTFLDDKTRTRRDHVKYLTLIQAIALLHQYQRPTKTAEHQGQTVEYIEATLDDIAVANRLVQEVLGRSLDELAPQTRRLLDLVDKMVTRACKQRQMDRVDYRFTRRDIREHTGWTDSRLKVHLGRLEDLEYLLPHRGMRGQTFVYELVYDGRGRDGLPFLPGLLDVGQLEKKKSGSGGKKSGVEKEKSGGCQGQVNRKSGRSQGLPNGSKPRPEATLSPSKVDEAKKAHRGRGEKSGDAPTVDGVN